MVINSRFTRDANACIIARQKFSSLKSTDFVSFSCFRAWNLNKNRLSQLLDGSYWRHRRHLPLANALSKFEFPICLVNVLAFPQKTVSNSHRRVANLPKKSTNLLEALFFMFKCMRFIPVFHRGLQTKSCFYQFAHPTETVVLLPSPSFLPSNPFTSWTYCHRWRCLPHPSASHCPARSC